MEYTKLTLEMTSPDYIDYFYRLPAHQKKNIVTKQQSLYKGINQSLINDIYDHLYLRSLDDNRSHTGLHCNCELKQVEVHDDQTLTLHFYHTQQEQHFSIQADTVILATGYKYRVPSFLEPVKEHIQWTKDGLYNVQHNYAIDHHGHKIFVQNAELHTHGFNAADLGMGPYRNAIIVNSILGYTYFETETGTSFQHFGALQS